MAEIVRKEVPESRRKERPKPHNRREKSETVAEPELFGSDREQQDTFLI